MLPNINKNITFTSMPLILHIEDNQGDIMLTQEAFEGYELVPEFCVAENGQVGWDYLQSGKPIPDLILLDLNMPVMDGKEFLRKMKQNERFASIPTVVLTTSKNEQDVEECYQLRANAYVQKKLDYDEFQELIHDLANFWLNQNIKPIQ